jgi:hypothetical protein
MRINAEIVNSCLRVPLLTLFLVLFLVLLRVIFHFVPFTIVILNIALVQHAPLVSIGIRQFPSVGWPLFTDRTPWRSTLHSTR